MRKYYLYTLIDPELKIPKYIGISNNPERRFKEHLEDKSVTKKTKWIKSLQEGGKIPTLKVLKETDNVRKVIYLEKLCIEKLQDKYNLVNSTKGGEYYAIGTPIKVYTLDGTFIDSYNSMTEYTELNNLSINAVSGISEVCLRKRNYAYNRIFRYIADEVTEEDINKLQKSLHTRDPKHFIIVSQDKEILGEFNSIQQAVREGFGSQSAISEALQDVPGRNSVNGNIVCYTLEEFDKKLYKLNKGKSKNTLKDCISKYDFEGNLIATFYTLSDAYRSVDPSGRASGNRNIIRDCCDNKYKQALGYQWRYGTAPKIEKFSGKIRRKPNQPVVQYSLNMEQIKVWNSAREAADELGIDRGAINRTAKGSQKTTGGYIWKYLDTPCN